MFISDKDFYNLTINNAIIKMRSPCVIPSLTLNGIPSHYSVMPSHSLSHTLTLHGDLD